jgi:Na+/H+ antiporter NhaD/arsenite permease-like protein
MILRYIIPFHIIFLFLFNTYAFAGIIVIAGEVHDTHGKAIDRAVVTLKLLDKKITKVTGTDGSYLIKAELDRLDITSIELSIDKPGYVSGCKVTHVDVSSLDKDKKLLLNFDFILEKKINPAFWISGFILIAAYVLIAFELLHRTLAAFLGASLVLFITYTIGSFNPDYILLSFDDAISAIDFNVILLLLGMMIIVATMRLTGIFQWIAYKAYQMAKGDILRLAIILMILTAVLSAFLDNVTTMLLLTPITIEIALVLRINPLSLLIPEVLASNIGGTATLIGDPPNIMIGSYAHLSFNSFIINLLPVVVICMIILIIVMKMYYKQEYTKAEIDNIDELLMRLKEEYKITDTRLLWLSMGALGFVILLFVLHEILHMEPSIAAMIGASGLVVIAGIIDRRKVNIIHLLEQVEWPTLIFFMMLFIIVGAAEETGLIDLIATLVKELSGGNLIIAIMLILWVSAIMSAIIDNIPFTATMLPVVAYLNQHIPGAADTGVLWWALALGACFGGNGTLVGASANIVTAGMAERSGYPLTFISFLKIGALITIITLIVASLYLVVVYIR